MRELKNIFKDIKSGALPVKEVPGFLLWAVRKKRRTLGLTLLLLALAVWLKGRAGK